jgi:hypothetical protein
VFVLLPFSPDFRWLLEREDSPWYPSARLFRQPRPGEWDSVVACVCAEIGALMQRKTAHYRRTLAHAHAALAMSA